MVRKELEGVFLVSKILRLSGLILFIFIVGCGGIAKYDDYEVVAKVRGEEVTVGELRLLFPDDKALDYLNGYIQVVLVKQEVKEMNLDISKHLEENNGFEKLPPKNTKDEHEKQIRKYAEEQAKKLDMPLEEFQKEYGKKINEQNAYINAYFEEKLVEEGIQEENEIENYIEDFHYLLEQLLEENEDEIEILIE